MEGSVTNPSSPLTTTDSIAPPPPSPLSTDAPSVVVAQPPASTANADADVPSSDGKEDWEIQRDHEKQKGDQAFRMGGYRTAIGHYTQAISLDPDFVVAYSNRSAAYLKNSEKSKALRDAERVTELDPKYAKGYSRLAAALHSLKRWEKAKDAYQKVLELDPANAGAHKGIADCQMELEKIQQAELQWAKGREETKIFDEGEKHVAEKEDTKEETKAGDQEEGDDLLNDFFEDVEEVTKKKVADDESPPAATNNVKNEKFALGTGQEQMDRLLQTNYEWRNLNPFYVLQLPHTATEDDIARRYKALSLMLHPDKNGGNPRAQQAFDEVKKAKTVLMNDPDRARHCRMLVEEGLKQAEIVFKKGGKNGKTLKEVQEKEVMRVFAQIEQRRREVEERERKFEQRTQQQEDAQVTKERQERQFDKSWRKEDRVDKRVGNWRDFASGGSKKQRKTT